MEKSLNIEVETVNKDNQYKTYLVNVENNKRAFDKVLAYFNNRCMDVIYTQTVGYRLTPEDLKEMIYI